ncbi:MAG TPA: D-alanine--D-alanine ligase [Thermoanaerobaculia bacterium]|nr:D-alanine--D-alanine ligase [Thermoanaerobaculia bacterium]
MKPRGPRTPLRIGLCYDLKSDYLAAGFAPHAVLEFDEEDTVAGLEAALRGLGHQVERVGRGVELARRLAGGERWDLVFNIAEGVRGRSREAQVPAVCEMFDQPYTFSDPLTCAITLDKPLAKRLVRDIGLPTAPFVVIESEKDVASLGLDLPLFVKPVAEGSSKGVTDRSRVASRGELRDACAELLRTYDQPVLVERYLPGREMTVGIVGNGDQARVLGVMEVVFRNGNDTDYTELNKAEYDVRVEYRLLDGDALGARACEVALGAYRALSCRDAARVDLRCDERGEPCFLEINPLPGLHPVRSDLPILSGLAGISYAALLDSILDAAGRRWELWS